MVTYTGNDLYWAPLKPRIRVYAFNDSTYSSPLYTYNPFTDTGQINKPVALDFDSQTTNFGTFGLEIEDSQGDLEMDNFTNGNRVFIECSKDGTIWQPAFKGLIRSSGQFVHGDTGHNIGIYGYSYLVRLNERIVNFIAESSIVGTPQGNEYNRNDSTMFTNNLIKTLLNQDSPYVYSEDDTAMNSIFKHTNIQSSAIVDWIPRIEAGLVSLNSAMNSILEFSDSLVTIDFSNDELVIQNPQTTQAGSSIFLLTDFSNLNSDDADITMYPNEPYTYNVNYDLGDSGSRLISSIGDFGCPERIATFPQSLMGPFENQGSYVVSGVRRDWATVFQSPTTKLRYVCAGFRSVGNNSNITKAIGRVYDDTVLTGMGNVGNQIGSDIEMFVDGIRDQPFPAASADTFVLSMEVNDIGPDLVVGKWYFFAIIIPTTFTMDASNYVAWIINGNSTSSTSACISYVHNEPGARSSFSTNSGTSWSTPTGGMPEVLTGPVTTSTTSFSSACGYEEWQECHWVEQQQRESCLTKRSYGVDNTITETLYKRWRLDFFAGGADACGGPQATRNADPIFCVAHDTNMSNKIGVVERVMTDMPTHIKKLQSLNEYLFSKVYLSSKPRFHYLFPSVTMPNKLPKGGDIAAHVTKRSAVGSQTTPVQTGIITDIKYQFSQDKAGILGLRSLGIETTGMRKGFY